MPCHATTHKVAVTWQCALTGVPKCSNISNLFNLIDTIGVPNSCEPYREIDFRYS